MVRNSGYNGSKPFYEKYKKKGLPFIPNYNYTPPGYTSIPEGDNCWWVMRYIGQMTINSRFVGGIVDYDEMNIRGDFAIDNMCKCGKGHPGNLYPVTEITEEGTLGTHIFVTGAWAKMICTGCFSEECPCVGGESKRYSVSQGVPGRDDTQSPFPITSKWLQDMVDHFVYGATCKCKGGPRGTFGEGDPPWPPSA